MESDDYIIEEEATPNNVFPTHFSFTSNINALEGLEFDKVFTPFDCLVMGALSSFALNKKLRITFAKIDELIGGSGKPNPKRIARIANSVERLCGSWVKATAGYKFSYQGHGVSGYPRTNRSNNDISESGSARLQDLPFITEFAQMNSELVTVDAELLKAPVEQTEMAIALQLNLLTTIERSRKEGKTTEEIRISAELQDIKKYVSDGEKPADVLIALLDFYVTKKINILKYEYVDDYKDAIRLYLVPPTDVIEL